MRFRDNLKIYREKLPGKVSAKDFAKSLKIPYSTYLGYENKGTEPKYDTLCQIAAALHVTTDELLGYTLDEYERCKALASESNFQAEEIAGEKDYVRLGILSMRGKGYVNFCHLSKKRFIEIVNSANTLPHKDFVNNLYLAYYKEYEQQGFPTSNEFDATILIDTIFKLTDGDYTKLKDSRYSSAYNTLFHLVVKDQRLIKQPDKLLSIAKNIINYPSSTTGTKKDLIPPISRSSSEISSEISSNTEPQPPATKGKRKNEGNS